MISTGWWVGFVLDKPVFLTMHAAKRIRLRLWSGLDYDGIAAWIEAELPRWSFPAGFKRRFVWTSPDKRFELRGLYDGRVHVITTMTLAWRVD